MAYNVKFLKGSLDSYNALENKDVNTFYYVGEKDLYLGSTKLSNGEDLAAAIVRIAAIEADYLKNADKTALQGQIDDINEELGALTGSDSGQSISQMIATAVKKLDDDLQPQITANANAIKAIKDDYLVEADKTELKGLITAEETRALAAEKVNADAIAAVKEDVDAFFADADLTTNAKDTLKEIQEYINSDATAAAEMTASINGVKGRVDTIEADYLKSTDKTELTNAINGKVAKNDFNTLKGRVDTVEGAVATKAESSVVEGISGKVTTLEGKVDVEKVSTAISTAVTNAVNGLDADVTSAEVETGKGIRVQVVETNGKVASVAVSGNYDKKYDTKGAANSALTNAKAYTDQEIGKLSFDTAGSAAQALEDAKSYADGLAVNYDAAGSAAQALKDAKAYANGLAGNYATAAQGTKADSALQKADITTGSSNGTIAVKGTDVAVKGLGSAAYAATSAFDAAGSANAAKTAAISAAATDATSKANTAEANAKAYTDTALTWGTI